MARQQCDTPLVLISKPVIDSMATTFIFYDCLIRLLPRYQSDIPPKAVSLKSENLTLDTSPPLSLCVCVFKKLYIEREM
jgi:hypothetical protein